MRQPKEDAAALAAPLINPLHIADPEAGHVAPADATAATGALRQLSVVLWKKHWLIRKRSHAANVQLFALPLLGMVLLYLVVLAFVPGHKSNGSLELLFTPLALVMIMQNLVVVVVGEKSGRLLESMKIMSLREAVYWAGHAAEALATAAVVAVFVASVAAAAGLFNGGSWPSIFALVLTFAAAASALGFCVAAVSDAPATGGQVALALQVPARPRPPRFAATRPPPPRAGRVPRALPRGGGVGRARAQGREPRVARPLVPPAARRARARFLFAGVRSNPERDSRLS